MIFGFIWAKYVPTLYSIFINIIKNKKNKEYQIIWAAGPSQYEEIKEKLSDDNININNIVKIKRGNIKCLTLQKT